MDYYLDFTIRKNPEITDSQVLNISFSKLHQALVRLQSNQIGISFPEAGKNDKTLGTRLRIHGLASGLDELMKLNWFFSLNDYIDISGINKIPAKTQHRFIQRIQSKSSAERLRRRLMKRHYIDENTALERIPDQVSKTLQLPFLQIMSGSTGQQFKLFLSHGPLLDEEVLGLFNSYGLSKGGTVPWF